MVKEGRLVVEEGRVVIEEKGGGGRGRVLSG